MNILSFTAKRVKLTPEEVFVVAYHYYEIRRNKENILEDFVKWHKTGLIPIWVVEYCFELINGNVKPIRLLGGY